MAWRFFISQPKMSKGTVQSQGATRANKRWSRQIALVVLLLLASTSSGSALDDDYQSTQFFRSVLEQVQKNYVFEVEPRPLVEAAVNAMLASLDPESGYIAPGAPLPDVANLAGDLPEIGLNLGFEPQTLVVVSTFDNSQAEKLGFETGDRIVAINNSPIQETSLYQAITNLRQSINANPVTLLVQRGDRQLPVTVTITKASAAQTAAIQASAKISMRLIDFASPEEPGTNPNPNPAKAAEPNSAGGQTAAIAVIRIPHFSDSTPSEVETVLKQAAAAASRMAVKTSGSGSASASASGANGNLGSFSGLILDLRQNTSGNYDAAIATSNLFLKSGVITTLMPRSSGKPNDAAAATGATTAPAQPGEAVVTFNANPAKASSLLPKSLPIVVLLDRGSSGATEVMAAALKDNQRAVIVGKKSYGSASFHRTIPLSNGGKLLLTVARWQRPNGQMINGVGIQPDILVSNPSQALQGIELGKGAKPSTPAKSDSKDSPAKPEDTQLLRAIDALRSMVIYANLGTGKK